MIELSTIRDLVAIFGVIAGFSYYVLTVRNNQRNQAHQLETRRAQLYMTMFNTINNQEIWKLIHEISEYNYTDYDDFMQKYGPTHNPEAFEKLTKVWWFFTEMGTLVYRGFITVNDCIHLIGDQPIEEWSRFETAIVGLREHFFASGRGYQTFEYLAKTMVVYQTSDSGKRETQQFIENMPDVKVPSLSELKDLMKITKT